MSNFYVVPIRALPTPTGVGDDRVPFGLFLWNNNFFNKVRMGVWGRYGALSMEGYRGLVCVICQRGNFVEKMLKKGLF